MLSLLSISIVKVTLPAVLSTTVWTPLHEGAVIFSTKTEVYYSINAVGTFVWERLSREGITLDTLCADLQARFTGASPEQLREDVCALLDAFERASLVQPRSGDA